eukprot:m.41233 g.41233  ORF g.41233 m.41233 type:complete len:154 (-) comp11439_c0_seq1:87-548(-)
MGCRPDGVQWRWCAGKLRRPHSLHRLVLTLGNNPTDSADAQGNFHLVFHVYNATTPCGECDGSLVSGHKFSADGHTWTTSDVSPFGNVIHRTDGTSQTLSTRERPKFLFNAQGVPTHLSNGACGGTATCPPTPGVNCKYNYWDFTLVQPLSTA